MKKGGSRRAAVVEAVEILRRGGLVAMPTETVYGLAADAFNPSAVAKIFALKGRPSFDPLITHVSSVAEIGCVAKRIPRPMEQLAQAFWPGPLTLILPKRDDLPDVVSSGLPTVGVRVPAHPVALELLREFGGALAAPSANRFGRISPTSAEAVRQEFGRRSPLILDGGSCRHGIESTIVRYTGRRIEILRMGAISDQTLREVASCDVVFRSTTVLAHPEAPGMLAKHYAPRTPLTLLPEGWRRRPLPVDSKSALLLWSKPLRRWDLPCQILSPSGSLPAAARRLYAAMRALDEMGVDMIFAELAPEEGIGRAINDRLRRAARTHQAGY